MLSLSESSWHEWITCCLYGRCDRLRWNTCLIIDVVKLFVKLGVNLNEQDWFGRTALHWAGLCENASLVEYLVERGGDLTIRTLVHKILVP